MTTSEKSTLIEKLMGARDAESASSRYSSDDEDGRDEGMLVRMPTLNRFSELLKFDGDDEEVALKETVELATKALKAMRNVVHRAVDVDYVIALNKIKSQDASLGRVVDALTSFSQDQPEMSSVDVVDMDASFLQELGKLRDVVRDFSAAADEFESCLTTNSDATDGEDDTETPPSDGADA